MAIKDIENIHKPDILSCLANLSSDEVFTPPNIANDMLNLLPEELFKSPDTKFLDPCCKSGVFLREIAKRLINGLRDKFPTLEKCLEHIFKKQLFGISITELTGLLSRRSLYCSRNASGEFSIVHFNDEQGNVKFNRTEHKWNHGRCEVCGAPKSAYDRGEILETHAYEFIHMNEDKIEELSNMQFDVVIGNPPYQLNDGGGNGKSAKPIYQFFINRAKELNPKYITMIIPARWYVGGKGLDEFRQQMLTDKRVRILDDFPITSDCFFEVTVKGGVCYFRWDRDDEGKCKISRHENGHLSSSVERYLFEEGYNVLIRYSEAIPILKKIRKFQEKTFDTIVSSRRPFGLNSNFKDFCNTYFKNSCKVYANKTIGYVDRRKIGLNSSWIDLHKIYISFAYGAGESFPHQIINKPFLGEPNSCCTETYLHIGPFENQIIAENVISYIKTKFFRFLVLQMKITQNATRGVYQFVPLQDFNEPWTDEKLYKKYGLSSDEIAFIESMIKPME